MNKRGTINLVIYTVLIILTVFLCLKLFVMREYTNVYKYYNETIIVKIWALYEPKKAFSDINSIYLKNNDLIIDEKEEYLNNLVKEYLDKNHFNKYIINMDNTIIISDDEFLIGLPDPIDDMKVTNIIKAKGKCISTYIKGKNSVSVISDKNCEKIAHSLLNKDVNNEVNNINKMKNVDAIFYIDGKYIKTKNFNKYM